MNDWEYWRITSNLVGPATLVLALVSALAVQRIKNRLGVARSVEKSSFRSISTKDYCALTRDEKNLLSWSSAGASAAVVAAVSMLGTLVQFFLESPPAALPWIVFLVIGFFVLILTVPAITHAIVRAVRYVIALFH